MFVRCICAGPVTVWNRDPGRGYLNVYDIDTRSKDAGPGEATRLCTVRRARAGARGARCTRTGVTGSEINPYHH